MSTERKLSELLAGYRTDRPDEWTMDEFKRTAEALEAKLRERLQAPPDRARITEQDAREIALSAWRHWNAGGGRTTDTWIEEDGRTLINKLNADRVPAVSVPGLLQALKSQLCQEGCDIEGTESCCKPEVRQLYQQLAALPAPTNGGNEQ